jgi:signal transduction histidine kinase
MENIISDYELKIKETHSRIQYDPLPIIEGVPQQLHQLFQNLLSNSLKFAKDDVPPLIQIRVGQLDAQQQAGLKLDIVRTYYQITFEDNGIGFEEEYAEKIFTIFQRLHSVALYQGAGIGLSICRQVVENHGGIIKAEGRLGIGSIFTIILPSQQRKDI